MHSGIARGCSQYYVYCMQHDSLYGTGGRPPGSDIGTRGVPIIVYWHSYECQYRVLALPACGNAAAMHVQENTAQLSRPLNGRCHVNDHVACNKRHYGMSIVQLAFAV